jgi:Spy/CpxP family protein refolding chaperone
MFTKNGVISNSFKAAATLVFGLVLASALLAQGPGWGGGPHRGPGGPGGFGFGLDGMFGDFLDLTDAQREQARALAEAARTESQPIHEQLRQLREEMHTAIQGGQTEFTLLAARQGELMGQLIGIQAKTHARMYALLTPEQKEKLAEFRERQKERMAERKNRMQQRTDPGTRSAN